MVEQPDGSVTELYSFDEAFEHHVRFVLWIVQDMDHFAKATSSGLRAWVAGLDPRYRPPCRATCIKILHVLQALVLMRIRDICAEVRAELGDPCFGAAMDLWSLRSAKETFACLRLSIILREVPLTLPS